MCYSNLDYSYSYSYNKTNYSYAVMVSYRELHQYSYLASYSFCACTSSIYTSTEFSYKVAIYGIASYIANYASYFTSKNILMIQSLSLYASTPGEDSCNYTTESLVS